MKIRSRKFEGRCARHKNFNPAVDDRTAIRSGCVRCQLLADIWDTSMRLNQLIRKFDPNHDDLKKPPVTVVPHDPRQMSFIVE